MIRPYKRLAELYDKEEWGKFSIKYINILKDLKNRYNFFTHSILDISCGTGDLINELSREYDVVGSDKSVEMIKIAKRKYPHLTFYVSDMIDLSLENKFDLILSPFDSINYIIKQNNLKKAFKNIYYLLNEKGYFLFDFNTDKLFADKCIGIPIERKAAGINFKQICEYNKETRIAKTTFDFGKGIEEVHIQRAYNDGEINNLLKGAGFEIKYSFDILKNEFVSDNSYKILIFAKKLIDVSTKEKL